MSEIMIEITITSKKDGSEKIETFPIDKGLYEATKSLSDEERRKFLTKEYRAYKKEQKIQRKQVSIDEVDEAYDLVHDVPGSSLDPRQFALEKEKNELLAKAIKQLRPRERFAIEEVFFNEKSQRVVAEEMKIDETTLSKLLSKALAKLKDKLSGKI